MKRKNKATEPQKKKETKDSNSYTTAYTTKNSIEKENYSKDIEKSKSTSSKPKSSKLLMVSSFAFMGFLFSFLTGYGHFDLMNGIQYGIFGTIGGFAVGYFPYIQKPE